MTAASCVLQPGRTTICLYEYSTPYFLGQPFLIGSRRVGLCGYRVVGRGACGYVQQHDSVRSTRGIRFAYSVVGFEFVYEQHEHIDRGNIRFRVDNGIGGYERA